MIFILKSTKKRKFGDHLTVHAPGRTDQSLCSYAHVPLIRFTRHTH